MNDILIAAAIVGGIGLVCSLVLALAAKFMAVQKDEREERLRAALPGANCGACGYTGCDGYACALADGSETKTNLCIPGADTTSRAISDILGVEFADVNEQVAFVACLGDCNRAKQKYSYSGAISSCAAANLLWNGEKACVHGCLGFGDCAAVCPNDAICIENGIAHVDTRKCTGCGLCTKACPNHIIKLISDTEKVIVTCVNREKGAVSKKQCENGCIGCKRCEKACEHDAIHVVNNLAEIDYEKCVDCKTCASVCPVGCIQIWDMSGIHKYNK